MGCATKLGTKHPSTNQLGRGTSILETTHCHRCHNPTPDPAGNLCQDCANLYQWCLTDYPTAVTEALAAIQPPTHTEITEQVKGTRQNPTPYNAETADKLLTNLTEFYTLAPQINPDTATLASRGLRERKLLNGAGETHQRLTTQICAILNREPWQPAHPDEFPQQVTKFWDTLRRAQRLAPCPVVRVLGQRARVCPVCLRRGVTATFNTGGVPVVACRWCGYRLDVPAMYLSPGWVSGV